MVNYLYLIGYKLKTEEEGQRVKKIIAALSLLVLLSMTGCIKETQMNSIEPSIAPGDVAGTTAPGQTETKGSGNLTCWAENEDEARNIAKLYGVNFVSYSNHIAVFDTDGDIAALIERGKKEGWPELSVNGTVSAFKKDT